MTFKRTCPGRAAPMMAAAPAEDLFRASARVGVGGVERGDALVQRGPDAVGGRLLLDLVAVGDPVPVRDLADHKPAAAKVSVFHDPQP
jgi:hypothetical protein